MDHSREPKVYRVRQLPLHLKDCSVTASFLALIAPALEPADNIRVFSLAQEKPDSKTATVSFKKIPTIFGNDREQWTLQSKVFSGQNIIIDTHFRGFTVLNEPQSCLHTVDCVAISGVASHPFGSWKYRESGSDFMWLRDALPQDVPKLRSLIYGYDTKLSESHSFQDLDDIAWSFIASLKEIRRSVSSAKPLILLAHSLGGIVVKRALVLLAQELGDEGNHVFNSVKGLVFFGVPHKGMKTSHLLAMVTNQPNEDLISRTLSSDSKFLSELDEHFTNIALRLNDNIMVVYETAESPLTEQNSAGKWVRSKTSYAVLVNKDSAIPPGTPRRNAIPVDADHSNMVKFGEGDSVYGTVKSFLFGLSNDLDIQRDTHVGRIMSTPVQKNARTFSTVPFPKDSGFVGREADLALIESNIANSISRGWASLYGLGGIGKSQIAIEYSYRQKERSAQTSTFWVHASSKARFEQSFEEIATAAEIPENEKGKAGILQLISKWLSNPTNGPWLLILDNADDATVLLDVPKVENGTNGTFVKRCLYDFIPRVQHGTVLITTRDRTCALDLAGDDSTPIKVEEMSTGEAVRLLRNRLPDATEEDASELVEELQNVPLAISQASAYIREVSDTSISTYLKKFRLSNKDQAALLNKGKVDLRRDREVPNAVITSWELSFIQIRKKSPRSADLLSLMSYLNRQAIPQLLLQEDIDDVEFAEVINPLLSFSLIRKEFGGKTYEMHRLVQTAMRHWLQSEGSDQMWKESAIARVAGRFPSEADQAQHWPLCEVLMSHANEVLDYVTSSRDMDLWLAHLLLSTAWYLSERRGNYSLAEKKATLALQLRKKHFTDDTREVFATLNVLAAAKMGLGKFKEAGDLRESILKHSQKMGGPENPGTLSHIHNLALSYQSLGLYEQAENQLKHLVEVEERVLGTEHPDFLTSAKFLANVQNDMGKHKDAEKESARVLEISRRCLGVEHGTTLGAMYVLSSALLPQDRLKEAENEIVLAIPLFDKVFGPSHTDTLQCRAILAEIYWRQAELNEAEKICKSCLDTAEEVYGLQHVTTSVIMNLLALVYQDQGKFHDALGLLKFVLESDQIVRGPDHPETLAAIFNLAWCYYDLGDKDQAIQLMGEVFEKRGQVLPADHPHTTESARVLADWKAKEEEIEEKRIEDAEGEEEGGEEDESDGEERREEKSEEEEIEEEESEGEKSKEKVGDKDETVGHGYTSKFVAGAQETKPRRKRRRID